ncbi:MAG TPA: DoxX family membrane protein [Candidatus Paceibacterota bacterium]
MDIAFIIGRIIVGLYFLQSAWGHLVANKGTIGYAATKVKYPKLAVIGSGLLLLVGGLSLLLGIWTFWGIIVLIVFLIPVTFTMHAYWNETDPMVRAGQTVNFRKNIVLVGLLLMLLSVATPWVYSVPL